MFILGYIAGLITAILIFIILAFFRVGIERRVQIIERRLEQAGPHEKGAILEPEDEAQLTREEYIEKNRREGKDTKLSELV